MMMCDVAIASDDAGQQGTCTFQVVVTDTIAPTIACPPDQSATGNGNTLVMLPAPISNALRVRAIALPARLCVPIVGMGAAEEMGTDPAEPRNSVSNNGSAPGRAVSLMAAKLPAR